MMKYIDCSSSSSIYEHQQQSCPTTYSAVSLVGCHRFIDVLVSSHDCWHRSTVMCMDLLIPFLRGTRVRDDNCYGLLRVSKARLLGICGAPDDGL